MSPAPTLSPPGSDDSESAARARAGDVPDAVPAPAVAPDPFDPGGTRAARAADAADAYLVALGFADGGARAGWVQAVLERLAPRAAAIAEEDFEEEAAVEEVGRVFDGWLAGVLAPDADAGDPAARVRGLAGARVALLGGAVPGWQRRFAARPQPLPAAERARLAAAIEAGAPRPLPVPAPLAMDTASIDLRPLALRERLARALGRASRR